MASLLHKGPIPGALHGGIEYLAGIFLIAAPFLFDYVDGVAVASSIVLGLAILAITATSALPTGLVKAIPGSIHMTMDYVSVVLLIAAPFVLAFRDETAPTAVFIILGVAHLLLTIGTRFPERASAGQQPGAPPPAAAR